MSKPYRVVLLWLFILVIAGCARLPGISKTNIRATTPEELYQQLRRTSSALETFRSYGPFEVTRASDLEINVQAVERYQADLFIPVHKSRAPLVIFLHGYGASKDEHAYQAMHVASWGLFGLTLQLPNEGPWSANGRTLARIIDTIVAAPAYLDQRIDATRIVLVGHSFGAAAVAGTLSEGAPVLGGVLLDPAVPERGLPATLARIRKPVMILGADEQVSQTKNRDYFFRFVRSGVFEISVRDATHEDAQFPADDFGATEAHQITFTSAITACALSLGMSGRLDYAWTSFLPALSEGVLLDAKLK